MQVERRPSCVVQDHFVYHRYWIIIICSKACRWPYCSLLIVYIIAKSTSNFEMSLHRIGFPTQLSLILTLKYQSIILSYQNSPVIETLPGTSVVFETPSMIGFDLGISTPPATMSSSLTLTPTSANLFVNSWVSVPGSAPTRKRRASRHSIAAVLDIGYNVSRGWLGLDSSFS